MAVELIAKGPNLDRVVAHLAMIAEDMETAIRKKDLRGWARADAAFHDALFKGASNRRLSDLAEVVTVLAMRARMVTLPYRPVPRSSNDEHVEIIQAINSGNWKSAVKLTREHRMRGLQTILKALHRMPKTSSPRS